MNYVLTPLTSAELEALCDDTSKDVITITKQGKG